MNEFLDKVKAWGASDERIDAVIVNGSWARGTNRPDSDIDLVVISSLKAQFIDDPGFTELFGECGDASIEYYGACTSIRVFYKDGPEVEFGFVEPSWLSLPLDAGTNRVLADGYVVLADRKGLFSDIERHISRA